MGMSLAEELCVERVGIAGEDVSVPASPFVARTIRLGMDLRRNVLEHEHHLIAPDDRPEVLAVSVTSGVQDLEPQPGLVELSVPSKSSTMKNGVTLFNVARGPRAVEDIASLFRRIQAGHECLVLLVVRAQDIGAGMHR